MENNYKKVHYLLIAFSHDMYSKFIFNKSTFPNLIRSQQWIHSACVLLVIYILDYCTFARHLFSYQDIVWHHKAHYSFCTFIFIEDTFGLGWQGIESKAIRFFSTNDLNIPFYTYAWYLYSNFEFWTKLSLFNK